MGTTTNHSLRYPENVNSVAVPADIKKLADDVDAKMISSAGGTVSGNVAFTGITTVQTPTANNHAATKQYVDNAAAIPDGSITGAKIANDTVTATNIAPDAVGSSELANNAVDTLSIQNDAVTSAKIAAGQVGTSELAPSSVDTLALQNSSVTAAKLSAGLGGLLTTKGDLVARDASTAVRLPVGADGTVLQADAGSAAGVRWGAEPADKASIGNLLTANQASGTAPWTRVGCTESGNVLTASGTGVMSARYVGIPVTGGATYTLTVTVTMVGRASSGTVIQWLDSGGGSAGTSAYGNSIPAGSTGVSNIVGVIAPATAVTATIYAFNAGTGTLGDTATITKFGFWKGTGGQWAMPGTPILGLEDGLSKIGNLLTANQAKPVTTGAWSLSGGLTEGSAGVYTTTTASGGPAVVLFNLPIVARRTYTFASKLAPVGRSANVIAAFLDAGGTVIGGYQAGTIVAAGATGISQLTVVAPVGTVKVHFYAFYSNPGSVGDVVTLLEAGYWVGASGDWQMPGVPIPNQAVLPVTQTPVPQTKQWAGSSWAPQPVVIGSGSPLNVVTPDFKGQEYVDNSQTGGVRKYVATTTVSSGWVANDGTGTIVDSDINASAAIAQSKISGLTTDLAAKAVKATIGNLLTANQASGTDTLGDTTGFTGLYRCTLESSNTVTYKGRRTLKFTKTDAGYGAFNLGTFAVKAGDTWTHRVLAYVPSGQTFGNITIYHTMPDNEQHAYYNLPVDQWVVLEIATGFDQDGNDNFKFTIDGQNGLVVYFTEFGRWRGIGGVWCMPGEPILARNRATFHPYALSNWSGSEISDVGNLIPRSQALGRTLEGQNATVTALGYEGLVRVTGTTEGLAFSAATLPITLANNHGPYTVRADVILDGGAVTFQSQVLWLDSAYTSISSSYGQVLTLIGSTLTYETVVYPPVGAAYARVYFRANTVSGAARFVLQKYGFWHGAGGTWAKWGSPVPGGSRIAINGAVDLSGRGAPEGIVTAAPGSTYLQTDAMNDVKGWIKWIKATGTGSTGWVAGPEADTGWRDVSSLLVNSWTASLVSLRRIGSTVTVRLNGVKGGATLATRILTIPAGFTFPTYSSQPALWREGTLTGKPMWTALGGNGGDELNWAGAIFDGTAWTTGHGIQGRASWVTDAAWPTSLPGTA